ncbi:MAG: 50S ribosomal protein L6 [Deltaproteobacteria bacterium]|jgi:large subunit ribosomal protein L6|nr:50S ribosomal protein L6 [Deltaproteobacteria bacterium]
MSRIGKKPILMPAGIKIIQNNANLSVQGPKGTLSLKVPQGIEVALEDKTIVVKKTSDDRNARSYHGLVRTLIENMVTGVSAGFEKKLEISGVGYRAEASSDKLKLVIGYSSPSEYIIPDGIAVRVDKLVNIVVSGIDKQLVGRVASEIRALRKPEPYKGKGIRYAGEKIRRKVGKSVGS